MAAIFLDSFCELFLQIGINQAYKIIINIYRNHKQLRAPFVQKY
jgi:hypothetical protein